MTAKRILRPVKDHEWGDAMALVWRVFLKYEADTYSFVGVQNFYNFITDDILYMMFKQGEYRMFGCYDGDSIRGVISVRDKNHISLLFVDSEFQHQGIAASLIRYLCDYLLEYVGQTFVTVNSSPYAVEFYHHMGFKDTGSSQESDGIIFTPMKFFL